MRRASTASLLSFPLVCLLATCLPASDSPQGPYDRQVAEQQSRLGSDRPRVRARAAQALGFLRAYSAEAALIRRLDDPVPQVRREVALALAWCGGRASVPPLLDTLDDPDWLVRQAAYVALTNLTGMEFPFNGLGDPEERNAQAAVWRAWWAAVPPDRPPQEVLELVAAARNLATGRSATASTTYRGPPDVLLDGRIGPEYWQTKFVDPPQWCTIDLGRVVEIGQVIVHQYSDRFVMTEYALATSVDGQQFETVRRQQGITPVELRIDFPRRKARYVRITSYGSVNPTYPTTFFEVEIHGGAATRAQADEPIAWRWERGLRALGTLGGRGASTAIIDALGEPPPTAAAYRPGVRAGIRSLGRLREEIGLAYLIRLLDNTLWARYAADALGDFGDPRAVPELLARYPTYAKQLNGQDPPNVPADDRMGFPSEDRMLETPYLFEFALARLPLDNPQDQKALARLAPLILANMQGDHDTFLLYQPEPGHLLTRYLLERSGRRREACLHAFRLLEQPARTAGPVAATGDEAAPGGPPPAAGGDGARPTQPPSRPADPAQGMPWPVFEPYRVAAWLPALCTREDIPRLVALLEHHDGWVRINAAKSLAFLQDASAIEPIRRALRNAQAEADFGYSGTFKDEEYNDPAPRWREGLIRALGILGDHPSTDLLVQILNDQRSVLEVRRAAADALADLGNDQALAALEKAALSHAFRSVRNVARDAVRRHGRRVHAPRRQTNPPDFPHPPPRPPAGPPVWDAVVFIQGSNNIPNTIGTVEQADRWRQTYVVTDSGPAYRPGRNLCLLRPPRPDGQVTRLTPFDSGYVAEPEVSWDGTEVIFCRRGQDDPWWHLWRIRTDGTGLEQLTGGPYHDVGPAYLPDGRIVFASSRSGVRDEYHGYPCTALYTMDPDGSDLQPIAMNIGRDNEPAVLADGRIAFSRLEVFYSRNKTELTLHAAHPDGTQDVVLYGPERRAFWRNLDHGPPTPADGQEAPLTHRVLRMTQPQPMADGRHLILVTQGGLTLVGPRRDRETIATPDNRQWSYTTPFPLPDGTVLCAATRKTPDRREVDLGLYRFDPADGRVRLLYNDPTTADFEPRPLFARPRPMTVPQRAQPHAYSGRFLCTSVFHTQESQVPVRGRLVRLIEGVPMVARHSTHTNPWPVWKNHGGTFARVLGMAPLAPDGSFYVEAPADRLLHFQVLDSDRRVVGNQRTWIYPRPGETKSCVGCHENPHTTSRGHDPLASHDPPLDFLPDGNEFTYRAKAWFKGHLPDEIEERTRTVRAVNLLGR